MRLCVRLPSSNLKLPAIQNLPHDGLSTSIPRAHVEYNEIQHEIINLGTLQEDHRPASLDGTWLLDEMLGRVIACAYGESTNT